MAKAKAKKLKWKSGGLQGYLSLFGADGLFLGEIWNAGYKKWGWAVQGSPVESKDAAKAAVENAVRRRGK